MRRAVLLFAFGLASTIAVRASADEPAADSAVERRAEQLFVDGQAAFEAGDYRRAATAFEAAHAAKRHPAVLWNASLSWQRAGEDLLAANDLERFLRESNADSPHRDEATKALAAILKRVGRVRMQGIGVNKITLDGEPSSEPTSIVAPGEHVLAGKDRSGQTVRKVFVVHAGETMSVILTASSKPSEPAPTSSGPLSPWFVIGGSVLVAAGVTVSVLSGVDTVNKANAFDADQTQANLDLGFESQARTNIAIGVTSGVAALTLAAAIFLVDWGGGGGGSRASAARRLTGSWSW